MATYKIADCTRYIPYPSYHSVVAFSHGAFEFPLEEPG
jgi:hypothetical protein